MSTCSGSTTRTPCRVSRSVPACPAQADEVHAMTHHPELSRERARGLHLTERGVPDVDDSPAPDADGVVVWLAGRVEAGSFTVDPDLRGLAQSPERLETQVDRVPRDARKPSSEGAVQLLHRGVRPAGFKDLKHAEPLGRDLQARVVQTGREVLDPGLVRNPLSERSHGYGTLLPENRSYVNPNLGAHNTRILARPAAAQRRNTSRCGMSGSSCGCGVITAVRRFGV